MAVIDYTSRDYESFRQDMIDLIPSKLPEWTDTSETDPGIVILELLAYKLDHLSYYNDRVANEIFLPTATQRLSVINHCKLIDYELEWHKPARHYQVFEIEPQAQDVLIPAGTIIGTKASELEESVIFETEDNLIIPAGKTGLEQDENGDYLYKVSVIHGQTIVDEFIGQVEEELPFLDFTLNYSPVLKDFINVTIEDDSGWTIWNRQDDFIGSDQYSLHYVASLDNFDTVHIQFGNGVSGMIPKQGSRIFCTYRSGGGEEGNVGANTITECFDSIQGFVQTFNPDGPYELGKDKESIESAKVNGPASLKRLNRYVTISDYETGIKQDVSFVDKVQVLENEDKTKLQIYVVPESGDWLTAEEIDVLEATIDDKKMIFTPYEILDATYSEIDVSVDITVFQNFDENIIKYTAENTIRDFFSDRADFGYDILLSELQLILMQINGVRNVKINTPLNDVEVADNTIPKLGTLTVNVTRMI